MKRRNFLGSVALGGSLLSQPAEKPVNAAPRPDNKAKATLNADLVVAGGGLGGCAAALAALRNGLSVILTEETDWIGGQVSQQGVPPDEHHWIETHGATKAYRAFRNAVREYYQKNYPLTSEARSRKNLNPGDGSVSKLCHEPRVGLAAMAGEWDVKVEFKPFPRAPWQDAGATTATIAPRLGGAALEEAITATVFGRAVQTARTWSWDRFADRYRVAVLDDYSSHLNVFEGTWGEDGRLIVSNAETGTRIVLGGEPVTERLVLHSLTADGFTLEHETTPDGGATWVGDLRLSYARKAGA